MFLRKIIIILFLVSFVCIADIDVQCVKLTQNLIYEEYSVYGKCNFKKSENYYSRVNGRVDSIIVKEGKKVKRGDILLTIDRDVAKAKQNKSKSERDDAKNEYNKNLILYKEGFISKDELTKSQVQYNSVLHNFTESKKNYDNMVIKARRDGYVGVVQVNLGDLVKPDSYLFSFISDENEKTVLVNLPGSLYYKIIGKDLRVYIQDSNDQLIQGDVLAISNYLDSNGTISARLSFKNCTKIPHGSYAKIVFRYNYHNAKVIDEKSVIQDAKTSFVYKVKKDNSVIRVNVSTNIQFGKLIEIISDELQEGDNIVLLGINKIYDGAKVQIIS